ncbi:MAG: hypothetical protein IJV64_02645 [Oscillospiraceae bacterium]|nr:hypothetical protein [Oscillospiraceae bacterium]
MNKRTDTLYSFWSAALIICLVLAVFAVIFASVLGNHGKSVNAAATPAPVEPTIYVAPEETNSGAGSSAAALPETADAGTAYIDTIYFLGDQALSALKSDSLLTGTDANKQVWVPAEGRLPLQAIDTTTYHSPVTGNNAPAADIALVNKPAVMLILPSPDNGNMVTRDELITAYQNLISAIQEQSPDTKIILSSLTPLAASYEYEDLTNETIQEINTWIAAAAEGAGVKYLDAYSGLVNSQGYLSEEYHDGDAMHLNSAGIQVWLDYVRTHAWE